MVGSSIPVIDGIPLRSALIIENRLEEIEDLEKDLKARGLHVISVDNSTEAEKILAHLPELDIIVLDWYMNEEDSMESKFLLNKLKEHVFALTIIYTKHEMIGPEEFIKERNLGRIVKVLDKTKLTGDAVFEEITRWIEESPEIRIFLKCAFEVEKTLNPVLWEVYGMEASGLRVLLESMKPDDEASYIRPEHDLTNLFLKALSRKMNRDQNFFRAISDDVKNIVNTTTTTLAPHPEDGEKMAAGQGGNAGVFHYFERYIDPPVSEPVWTGDIIKKSEHEFFVVVTPSCDLCHQKIDNVILVKTVPFGKYIADMPLSKEKIRNILKYKTPRFHYLPYIEKSSDGLLCFFDHISSMKIDELKKDIENEKLERIATIDSPFIENLIQRMNAYLMRLGVRDIAEGEIERILSKKDTIK